MLTTLATIKSWLKVTGTEDDTLLTRLGEAASAFVGEYLSRDLLTASRTEDLDGTGGTVLTLRHYPVTSVTSVATITGQALVARVTDRRFLVFDQPTPVGFGNIRVAYVAGLAAVPSPVEQAVVELVGTKYRERERIGHVSKSLAGETVTFFIGELPANTRLMLNQYADKVVK